MAVCYLFRGLYDDPEPADISWDRTSEQSAHKTGPYRLLSCHELCQGLTRTSAAELELLSLPGVVRDPVSIRKSFSCLESALLFEVTAIMFNVAPLVILAERVAALQSPIRAGAEMQC